MDQNQPAAGRATAKKLDILYLIKLCFKSWKIFVISIIACFLIGFAWTKIRPGNFEVDAQLMLPRETTSGGLLALADMASSFSMGDMFGSSSTDNEIAVISSQSVFENTVRQLGLNISYKERQGFMQWVNVYEKPKIRISAAPEIADTLMLPILFKVVACDNGNFDITAIYNKKKVVKIKDMPFPGTVDTPIGEFTFTKTDDFDRGEPVSKFTVGFTSYNFAAQQWVENVNVYAPSKKTDIITLSVLISEPDFGKKLLNTIIANYNNAVLEQKNFRSGSNMQFIDSRIATIEQELATAETDMERFKETNNITDPTADATMMLQKSAAVEAQLLQAQTENEILKITLDFLSDPANNYSLIPVTVSPSQANTESAVPANIAAYNQLVLERMKLMSTLKTENEAVRVMNQQIDVLRANILSSLKRAVANSNVIVSDLKRENNQMIARMGSVPRLEREYVGLERDLRIKHQLYLFLLKQKEEVQMNREKVEDNIVVMDQPYVLMKSPGLSKKMVLLLSLFLGFILALAFVYLKVMPKAPLPTKQALKDVLDAPVLGDLAATDNDLPVTAGDDGETLRRLRGNVIRALDDCNGKVVMVVSAKDGEGKTYTADNLASALALAGYSTALVDADIRNPQAHAVDAVDLVTLDADGSNPADVLAAESTRNHIARIRDSHQYVVIDTPSLDNFSDAFGLTDIVDLTLFVVRPGVTTEACADMANNIVAKGTMPRVAIVLNAK